MWVLWSLFGILTPPKARQHRCFNLLRWTDVLEVAIVCYVSRSLLLSYIQVVYKECRSWRNRCDLWLYILGRGRNPGCKVGGLGVGCGLRCPLFTGEGSGRIFQMFHSSGDSECLNGRSVPQQSPLPTVLHLSHALVQCTDVKCYDKTDLSANHVRSETSRKQV